MSKRGRRNRLTGPGLRVPALSLFLACLLPAVSLAAPSAIGVAAFERVAAEGHGVPDVAARLAQRLGTKGVDKVVGPGELGAPPRAEPAVQDVAGWAAGGGVDYIVVGRTTRLGNSVSVTARLLEAGGQAIGPPMVEEASRPEELGRAVEALAIQVLERVEEAGPVNQRASAPAAAGAAAPAVAAKPPRRRSGGIQINADSLEAEEGPPKKMLFSGNVKAVQEGFTIFSNRLEASYPKGKSQPDRMVATGSVKIREQGRNASCRKAIFFLNDRKVVCTGNAVVEQSCDRVKGEKITFFLDGEKLMVEGAADMQLRSDDPNCGGAA
ncbi:MAG: LptA/OstA family protein [Myxococcota bacterium]|nr:LptA/OstA family protein [Myxococcota bacterium]